MQETFVEPSAPLQEPQKQVRNIKSFFLLIVFIFVPIIIIGGLVYLSTAIQSPSNSSIPKQKVRQKIEFERLFSGVKNPTIYIDLKDALSSKEDVEILNLESSKLTEFPLKITEISNLKGLNLSTNSLTKIPNEISKLTNLNVLVLDNNKLTRLPPEIGSLTNLTYLSLENNQLTSLPPEIGNLTNLAYLSLDNNGLSTLPVEIQNLQNLINLRIRGNKFTTLPDGIKNLKKLVALGLANNHIPHEEIINLKTFLTNTDIKY